MPGWAEVVEGAPACVICADYGAIGKSFEDAGAGIDVIVFKIAHILREGAIVILEHGEVPGSLGGNFGLAFRGIGGDEDDIGAG